MRCLPLAGPLLAITLLCQCQGPLEPSDLEGTWGGEHVEVAFDAAGTGSVEYDCAHGVIRPPIALSTAGALSASGEHVREHGGPVQEGETPDSHPARYSGQVHGDRLTFTVTLTDSGTVLGPYTVRRGQAAQLLRCL